MSEAAPRGVPIGDLEFILERTAHLWEEIRGQRLFITGGTGFFGTWLLETFAWVNARLGLNAEAVVLSRNPNRFLARFPHLAADPAIRFHEGDVRDFSFPAGVFSHVIHAATEASAKLNDEQPEIMVDTIVRGTQRVLDGAIAAGVRKLLFTSSGAVYGLQPPEITHVPEDFTGAHDPRNRNAPYGLGKRLAEVLCHRMAERTGLDIKIARCFAFVGPHLPLDAHFAVGNFIRDALCGGPITLNGDGTPLRSYLYAADLTIWLWTILFAGPAGEAFNVGSDVAFPLAEVAGRVARQVAPAPDIVIRLTPQPGTPVSRYVPSIEKARRVLGLDAWHFLDQALGKTLAWEQSREQRSGNPR